MANYLQRVSGYTVPDPGTARSKEDVISMGGQNWYTTRIYSVQKNGKSLSIEGYVSEAFSLQLSANWAPPFGASPVQTLAGFGGAAGQLAGQAVDFGTKSFGTSTNFQRFTAQTWSEPEYLEVSLPIVLKAYSDTDTEVLGNMRDFLKTVAPYLGAAGNLHAPGPSLVDQATSDGKSAEDDMTGAFTVEIGSWFRMYPAIIRSVNAEVDGKFEDGTGNPISANMTLSMSSYYAVTQDDIDRWIIGSS